MGRSCKKRPSARIRELVDIEDCLKLPDILLQVRGLSERDLTSPHQYRVSVQMGGILLAAFIRGELVGFVYSFPGIFDGKLVQHSHQLAVLPQFQGYGIGKALKWAQRDWALRRGYSRITWTFDPLQSKNANLNFHTLGGLCRTYLPNFYGMGSALNLGPRIPTDRLFMEWPIRQRKVEERRKGRHDPHDPSALAMALERKSAGAESAPARPRLNLRDRFILAEAPASIRAWRESQRLDLIAAWQKGLRQVLMCYFGRGYAASDFLYGDRCFYVLERRRSR